MNRDGAALCKEAGVGGPPTPTQPSSTINYNPLALPPPSTHRRRPASLPHVTPFTGNQVESSESERCLVYYSLFIFKPHQPTPKPPAPAGVAKVMADVPCLLSPVLSPQSWYLGELSSIPSVERDSDSTNKCPPELQHKHHW